MQTSTAMNNFGLIGRLVRLVWTLRNVISIVLILGTLIGYFSSEMIEQRRVMVLDFSDAQSHISDAENALRVAGNMAFRGASRDGEPISQKQSDDLQAAVSHLRSTLLSATMPNGRLERARASYLSHLVDLQGKLNLFSPTAKSTETVLKALVAIERPSDSYHEAATQFETSVWTSFWAAF